MKEEQLALYVSPQVETVEIKSQAIICQSGGIDGFNPLGDDTDNWN